MFKVIINPDKDLPQPRPFQVSKSVRWWINLYRTVRNH